METRKDNAVNAISLLDVQLSDFTELKPSN